MRHLKKLNLFSNIIPETVVELGPGDSTGTGFAALLSGCKHIFEIDRIKYWNNIRNLRIFDELTGLFRDKAAIPDNREYPRVRPSIDTFDFPSSIFSDKILEESLSPERLLNLKDEITKLDDPGNSFIKFFTPEQAGEIIRNESIDFIYSQAVLECIDDLDNIFSTMNKWLKPGGFMSHTIDLKSHGLTKEWNGHWTFNNIEWYLVKGERKSLLNREPLSEYIRVHLKHGFRILLRETVNLVNNLKKSDMAEKYRTMSDEDLSTSGIYILSRKEG
jgi:SAM-dependent methyltransferase